MDISDSFSEVFSKRLVKSAYDNRIPFGGVFELLPTCNMRCRMCYIQHTPKHEELQPVDFWVDQCNQAIEAGMLFLLLTGGEVFLRPDFFELYEKLSEKPIYLSINTNATLLDREKVKTLAKRSPHMINISLYGASDETYAALCGNSKGFSQVMQAFDLLKEYDIPFKVNGVLVPENIRDYQEIKNICNRYRVRLSMSNYIFPAYRKELQQTTTDGRFEPIEMARSSLRYLKDHYIEDEHDYKMRILQYCAAMENPKVYQRYNEDTVPCKGGICSYWVDWRGNISACGMHNQGKVDLHETAFKEAWAQIVAHTNEVRMSSKCKLCRYRCICPVCPAANFCETGSLSGTPEYLCQFCEEYGKLLFEERKRLFENG